MKTKHLFLAMALPAVFAACSNEEFISEAGQNQNNVQGRLVTLAPNFALVQNNEGTDTRGAWETNKDNSGQFVWMPVLGEDGSTYAPDEIGYSWTGLNFDKDGNLDAVGSALGAYSDRVFTNYKFTHFAWKKYGEEIKQNPCSPYDWISGVELLQNKYYDADWKKTGTAPTYKEELQKGEIDLVEGLFNTTNSTVYAGQYIVYAPYDAKNVSNYIMATSKKDFTSQLYTKGGEIWENNNIFIYGKSLLPTGGVQTTNFSTRNLNGYVMVTIKDKDDTADKIKKVILYDAKGRLLTKVGLSAKGIMEDKTGKDLYLAEAIAPRSKTTTITTNMTDGTNAYVEIAKTGSSLLIPVLPTESALDNVEVILIDESNKAFRHTVESLDIKSNTFTNVEIKDVDFENKGVLVTDEETLRAETNNPVGSEYSEGKFAPADKNKQLTARKVVELLGDIEITKTIAIRDNYTLNGGRIILKANKGEKVENYGGEASVRMLVHGSSFEKVAPVINSDILAEAAGCCKKYGGLFIVGNAVLNGNIETQDQNAQPNVLETYIDDLSSDRSQHGFVKFYVTGATAEVNGHIVNNGRLDFGRSDRGANESGKTEQLFVNVVKGNIQNNNLMTLFRYEVSGSTDTNLSTYVYIDSQATLNNNGTFTVEGKLAMYGQGKNSGTIYDRVSSTVSGNLLDYNAEGAEYICDVNNPGIRFKDAVDGKSKPTTTVRFIEEKATYNFEDVTEESGKKIAKYVVAENEISFQGDIKLSGKDIIVEKGATLNFKQFGNPLKNSILTVENLTVKAGGQAEIENVNATVNKVMTISGMATVKKGMAMVIGKAGATQGKLEITAYKAGSPAEGYFVCENNSTTTVYGDIVNKGLANIIEAAATASDIPAYLYYTNTLTASAKNWQQGGASLIK